jgi:hypothetical protein
MLMPDLPTPLLRHKVRTLMPPGPPKSRVQIRNNLAGRLAPLCRWPPQIPFAIDDDSHVIERLPWI